MPRLYNKKMGALPGTVSDADVECLVDVLEEEDSRDVDSFSAAIGASEVVGIRWDR